MYNSKIRIQYIIYGYAASFYFFYIVNCYILHVLPGYILLLVLLLDAIAL